MIPEAELIRKELILRNLDLPDSVLLTRKSLLRWTCLSLGLISPKETRDKALLIYDSLFTLIFSKKESPTTLEIQAHIKEKTTVLFSEKIIRYHLNRLIALGFLQRKGLNYSINPNPKSEHRNSLKESFNAWLREPLVKDLDNIENALEKMQKLYEGSK